MIHRKLGWRNVWARFCFKEFHKQFWKRLQEATSYYILLILCWRVCQVKIHTYIKQKVVNSFLKILYRCLVLCTKQSLVNNNEIYFPNTQVFVVSVSGIFMKLVSSKGNTHTSSMVLLLIQVNRFNNLMLLLTSRSMLQQITFLETHQT